MVKDPWTLLAVAATVVMMAGLLAPRSLVPHGERLTPYLPHQDKVVHLALFAVFGYTWTRAGSAGRLSGRRAALVLVLSAVLAIGTELAQGLEMIHRDPDPLDALADLVGAAFGVLATVARGRS